MELKTVPYISSCPLYTVGLSIRIVPDTFTHLKNGNWYLLIPKSVA